MESDGEFIMAVKYLSGNRLWGTNAERLAMSLTSSSIGNVATCKVVGATAISAPNTPVGWALGSNCINFVSGSSDFCDGYGLRDAMDTKGSISFWFNQDAETDSVLMGFADDGANTKIEIKTKTTRKLGINVKVSGTTEWEVETSDTYNPYDNWNHVVITHDGIAPKIYLNGSLASLSYAVPDDKTIWWTALRTAGANNVTIGCMPKLNNASRTDFYDGQMTNIAFWNEEIDSDDVTALWDSDDGALANTIPTNQTAYFKCQAVEDGTFELGDLSWDVNGALTYEGDNNNNGTLVVEDESYIHGLKAKGAILWLKKVGTMTGTATVGVWENSNSGSDKDLVGSAGDITSSEANALSSSTYSEVTRYFTERTLETNDTIALQCNTADGFDVSNTLEWEYDSSGSQWDALRTKRNRFTSGSWSPTSSDMHMSIITESDALVNYPVSSYNPNLPNGSVFITSDTNVHYMWDGTDTWNEVA